MDCALEDGRTIVNCGRDGGLRHFHQFGLLHRENPFIVTVDLCFLCICSIIHNVNA